MKAGEPGQSRKKEKNTVIMFQKSGLTCLCLFCFFGYTKSRTFAHLKHEAILYMYIEKFAQYDKGEMKNIDFISWQLS